MSLLERLLIRQVPKMTRLFIEKETKMLLSDEELTELLRTCGQGNKASLSMLYECISTNLNSYAYRYVRCEALSNEVLQDSFIQIWLSAGNYNAKLCKPITWMRMIVRSRAIDKLRAENKHPERCNDVNLVSTSQPECELIQAQVCQQLHDDISSLPKNMQTSVNYTYFHGLSRDELATSLDTNINTVKSWLRRSLISLQRSHTEEAMDIK